MRLAAFAALETKGANPPKKCRRSQGYDDQSVRDASTSNQCSVGTAIPHHITRGPTLDRISGRGALPGHPGAGDQVAQTNGCHGVAQNVGSPSESLSLVVQDQVDDGKGTPMIIPLRAADLPKSHASVKGPRALILLIDVDRQVR